MKPPCCPEKVWLLCRASCELSVQFLQLVNTSSVWGPNVKGFVVTMCKSFSRWRFLMSFEYMDGAQASKDIWANQWEKKCSKQEQLCQTTRLPGCLMMSRFGHKSYEMPRVEGSLKLWYVQNSLRLIGASICSSSLDIFFCQLPVWWYQISLTWTNTRCSSSQKCIFKWTFFVFVAIFFLFILFWLLFKAGSHLYILGCLWIHYVYQTGLKLKEMHFALLLLLCLDKGVWHQT